MAASLLSSEAVAALRRKTTKYRRPIESDARRNTVSATQSSTPRRPAAAVITMMATIVRNGRHRVAATPRTSERVTMPNASSTSMPAKADAPGRTSPRAPIRGRLIATPTVSANVE